MKKYLTLISLLLIYFSSQGQKLKTIQVSEVKVINIYFKEDVASVETGYPDDFDVTYIGKIVKITSLSSFSYETNLSVTTSNGMYGFNVVYKEKPDTTYFVVEPNEKAIIFDEPIKAKPQVSEEIISPSNKIVNDILLIKDDNYLDYKEQGNVYFVLNGAYVKDDKIFFYFLIDNHSAIDYDIDYVSVKIKSTKKVGKRTAKEQYDIKHTPHALSEKIKIAEKKYFVLEINKLTLESKTKLVFGIHEKDGGRDGVFDFTSKDFNKIKILH